MSSTPDSRPSSPVPVEQDFYDEDYVIQEAENPKSAIEAIKLLRDACKILRRRMEESEAEDAVAKRRRAPNVDTASVPAIMTASAGEVLELTEDKKDLEQSLYWLAARCNPRGDHARVAFNAVKAGSAPPLMESDLNKLKRNMKLAPLRRAFLSAVFASMWHRTSMVKAYAPGSKGREKDLKTFEEDVGLPTNVWVGRFRRTSARTQTRPY